MIIVLTLTALITATISSVIGMGGGVLLLATIFCFLPHGQAIPLHAAVQLVGNGSRIVAFRRHVDWATVGRYALGVVPGGAISIVLLWLIGEPGRAEPYLKTGIGVYILVLTLLPNPSGFPRPQKPGTRYDFTLLGLAAGSAAILVGAVGPLIAPLFARRDFAKERLVATKAVCQMFTHAIKIPAFGMLGTLSFAPFTTLFVAMAIAVIPGAFLGRRILRHVSQERFILLYRLALTIAGLKILIVDGVLRILALH